MLDAFRRMPVPSVEGDVLSRMPHAHTALIS